ncbi:MAG: molybdopterin molybdotransferase MoeA [Candidatus Marinimicrobia bacterium]|nr:molybdopterin molybdotransferase MoeA [Candidatus Neomarinimicrobiota bacterium]
MISVENAQSIIQEHILKTEEEMVTLSNAGGRILATDIFANFPMLSFDNSAMDGFAVRSIDTIGAKESSPVTLKVAGISSAGNPTDLTLNQGECAQCMTGAEIPKGADAIVIVENSGGFTDLGSVQIFKEAKHGDHIRKLGEEIPTGTKLISKGTQIAPGEVGTLATFGYGELSVAKKPMIAIFGTGDELINPGETLKQGQIYNSNLPVLAELGIRAGGEVVMQEVIKDDKDSLNLFLSKAMCECDIVISSGGISMGKYDYVRNVFRDLGVMEEFWKVAQKPGKPLFFGTTPSTLIFGLPGNPVSSYICFVEYIIPIIQEILGLKKPRKLTAVLTEDFPSDKKKQRFLFGKAWINTDGKLVCAPTSKTGSHMLTSSLDADCIIEAQPSEKNVKAGETITIQPLNWRSIK